MYIGNLPSFYFRSIWPNDLKHVSHGPLRTGAIFTKFKVGRHIRSWFITVSLLTRYVTVWPWPLTPWPWTFELY